MISYFITVRSLSLTLLLEPDQTQGPSSRTAVRLSGLRPQIDRSAAPGRLEPAMCLLLCR
jgi:hypothetical protein